MDGPEDFGGHGLGKDLAARILEFLSLDASFSVTVGITSGISQAGLILFGTDEQKRKYLPDLASGTKIGAFALSEPNSGTDALGMSARAVRQGDAFTLDGTKMWISNAEWASTFTVVAKVDDGYGAFIVERDFPGVTVGREEHKMGLKGSSTARLQLDHVKIEPENVLHELGKGHQVAFNSLNLGRFKLCAMSLGVAREALTQAIAYAQDRRQFGQPISEFGLIQKKFADMAARFFAAESMTYRLGHLIDEAFDAWGGTADGNRRAAEEFAAEASICKVACTEAQGFVVDEAMQVHGGYGFTEEFPIARLYRDCRVSRIYEGTNEINRVAIAHRLNRHGHDGRGNLVSANDSFISELTGKAFAMGFENQVHEGALADLAILLYGEQSVRARARQVGGVAQLLADHWLNWANHRAAQAYSARSGESVSVPEPTPLDLPAIAASVYKKGGPI
jgi:alkylation response protein AidB-like acyl-CoA dehydrogenase